MFINKYLHAVFFVLFHLFVQSRVSFIPSVNRNNRKSNPFNVTLYTELFEQDRLRITTQRFTVNQRFKRQLLSQ